ncbi:MAG TPA: DUF2877 domain-containing protein [Nitrososphaerales archaeon]|nr:DUF2877 domain-containing protein [Nitrososphaerales archaeon]
MNQKASSIGNIATEILSKDCSGEVTRVFGRSTYIRAKHDFVLLLWGGLRSPVTVNIEGDSNSQSRTRVGERCSLSREKIGLGDLQIDLRRAEVFRSALLRTREITLPKGTALAKGVAMLRSLYEVSPAGPTLPSDPALRTFVGETLVPFANGNSRTIFSPVHYLPLIGRGGGFTPAGDDFVGGVVTVFNYVARCRRTRQVMIPSKLIHGRTVPESAMILSHSARGNVDEGTERLILASTGGGVRFYDELLAVARRGHTSGIDMSLGVMLCEAALAQTEGESGALQKCLDTFWNP